MPEKGDAKDQRLAAFLVEVAEKVGWPGYSEVAFSRLTVGMTRAEAEAGMCSPLGAETNKSGLVRIFYTSDGAAPFGDFAWFGRGLEISNGVVTRVIKTMYMD